MSVTVIPIVNDTLERSQKALKRGLEELEISRQLETTHTTKLLKSDRILGRILRNCGNFLSLRLQ